MKTALIISNHGNHSGFNRKWSLVKVGTMKECKEEKKNYKDKIEDNYIVLTVTQSDINADIFNGGYYGYFPPCLKEIFQTN